MLLAGLALYVGCTHSKGEGSQSPTRVSAALASHAMVADRCEAPHGIRWAGHTRFWAGANYAWSRGDVGFGADFGGIASMHKPGAAAIQAEITANFRVLRKQGASFIRWFVFPATGTDGITWSRGEGTSASLELPTGLSASALRDVDAALNAAADADVYLILTIFSFDAFRQTHVYGGATNRSLQPLLDPKSADGLRAIEDGIVAPLVHRVRAHTLHERVAAWDIINEPEWAVTGLGCEGMQSDDRRAKRSPVQCTPIATMQTFLATTAATIRANSTDAPALITVGAASLRTAHHWATREVGQDFYQVHRYDHQPGPSPTDTPAAESSLNDRPILLGELPGQGLDGADALTTLNAVHRQGYAGALLWSFSDRKLGWDPSGLAQFVGAGGCQTRMPPP